jgi:hypothetical protein
VSNPQTLKLPRRARRRGSMNPCLVTTFQQVLYSSRTCLPLRLPNRCCACSHNKLNCCSTTNFKSPSP